MLPRRGYEHLEDEDGRPNAAAEGGSSTRSGYAAVSDDAKMAIKVLDVTGTTYNLSVALTTTVRALKLQLATVANVEPERQRIIHMGKVLQEDDVLAENKVKEGTCLHLFQRPKGPLPPITSSSEHGSARGSVNTVAGMPGGMPHITVQGGDYHAGNGFMGDAEWQLDNARRGLRFLASFLFLVSTMQALQALAIMTAPADDPMQGLVLAILVRSAMGMGVGAVGVRASHGTEPYELRFYFWGVVATGVFAILIRADILYDFWNGTLPISSSMGSSFDDDSGAGRGHGDGGGDRSGSSSTSMSEVTQSDLVFSAFISLVVAASVWTWCAVRAYQYGVEIGRSAGDEGFQMGCWPARASEVPPPAPAQPDATAPPRQAEMV